MFVILPLPIYMDLAHDPAPGLTASREEVRNLECRRLDEVEAHHLHPEIVGESSARGDYIERDVVVCERRMIDLNFRRPRDEAILSRLQSISAEIVRSARALPVAGTDRVTWMVEVFYPEPQLASKISFAVKNDLIQAGEAVSDRTPRLTAQDIAILGPKPVAEGIPVACARYHRRKTVADGQRLLGVVLADAEATDLSAGVCDRGEWRWVR